MQTLDFGALMATAPPPEKKTTHTHTHTHTNKTKQNMQSAEIGFKNQHYLIPFSQKKKKKSKVPPDSLTSREEKLSRTILSLNEKNLFHVPSTPALLLPIGTPRLYTYTRGVQSAFIANHEILQKKKMKTQSARTSRNAPCASFFRKFCRGGPRPPTPLAKGNSLTH